MTPADIARVAEKIVKPFLGYDITSVEATQAVSRGIAAGLEMAAAWHEAEWERTRQLTRDQKAAGNLRAAVEWQIENQAHSLSIDVIRAMKVVG